MEANFSFDSAEFTVTDVEKRTVKLLAVPYGEPSELRQEGRYVFSKGSITVPQPISKVKLLRHHDKEQSVGYATSIEETDRGLEVTFKIATGPEGDRALAGFTDGNYDAASIGAAEIQGKKDKRGFIHVLASRLKEVSQVAIPAFENAGLISVTATSEGENMTDLDPAVVPAEKTYTLAEIQNFLGLNKETKVPASIQEDENVAPRELKANAQEKAVVKEPAPYRFDGAEGRFEFSSDIISMNKGDGNAKARVLDFMAEEFAVTTSNAATLNPTIQRPDMYVDQLDYTTPIWNTIYKGTPPNGVNPFAFPKYSSSSGLVADHVEGTEPTLGAFAVTNQTVTPSALSGKIEINREAWDMGGNPSLSNLIRNEMRRSYREGLETSAAAFLDAQSFTTITLTTAAADSALEGEVIAALVALQNARGGFRLTDLLLHTDLFKALVLAKDSTGRRLYPVLGPTNANGVVTSGYGSININGLVGRNAWALGASGIVAEKSYLLNPTDVHGWATAPQDMTFDIQVKSVYLGIWGYKAFAVSRTEGVRTLSYDPAA
jgi:HK97 family phage prohead protease